MPTINIESAGRPDAPHPLSFSRQLEKSYKWKTVKVLSFLRKLRTNLMHNKGLTIDSKADKNGLPTHVRSPWVNLTSLGCLLVRIHVRACFKF